ncbi:ADP-dependent glucokinase/phosphofructokinase [Methanococcoides alaskense]|uniref:ADP-dependent phosphofructokinase/glucokinase n=1 Tax=Methanococcoides alaskense TaxID=325778 RepID=A0AA90ZBL7_9EURY|nr:ADP-dependent glucokinase/phosphofructokinase [Methanococcoides alaskense]MDA0525087.1 ADP-dependent glucokinase [Methanococcoides alaskense]MDR6221993.1 ADP-dependent phosphofructokinase/glucokinase [Methanococcoides alaskense]
MKVLCGYNVNIDAVYTITGEDISDLLKMVDKDELLEKIYDGPGEIRSITDLVAGLVLHMQKGTGAEWFIYSDDVFHFLKSRYYEKSEIRLGGNMGIMANVMSHMGADQVVMNAVGDINLIKALMSGGNIIFSGESVPQDTSTSKDANEIIHFVFDFSSGTQFDLFGTEVIVPRENRFIATYDDINTELTITPEFEEYSLEHVKDMDGAIISGFNQLQRCYPDGSGYSERFEKAHSQLKDWKALNPDLPIHVELGHFMSMDMGVSIFKELAGTVDSIGMNEDELVMLTELHGVPSDMIRKMDACTILDACVRCASSTGLKKIVLHTRDFMMSIFSKGASSSIREMQSMQFGVNCAAVFAASGRLPERSQLEDSVSGLARSEGGVKQVNKMQDLIGGERLECGVCGDFRGFSVCILPTIICEKPVSTVGLGDTVSSATFLRWLEIGVNGGQ